MILIDTHVLVWWLSDPEKLSALATERLFASEQAGEGILVSCISTWEVAMLVRLGRLQLRDDVQRWIAAVEQIECISFVPISNQIAIAATQLPAPVHKDSADRMLIATARLRGITLLTADEKIRQYPHVDSAW